MYGMVQSFNVSVASALMLSEASRQRALAGMYESRLWDDEEYEERLNKWLEKA
jgi:tRNA (guanosine-2'-O-)-methyltransferase